jgi:hypothetical protein
MLWRPWLRWSSYKGGLGILLDSMFISTTAVFTSQKSRNSFSSRISCGMFPTILIAPTLPSDFWMFGRNKTGLAGRSFAEPEELFKLLEGVREFLEGIPAAELTVDFEG